MAENYTPKDIETKIRELIAAQFDVKPEEVTLEKSLVNDFKADSLGIIELIMDIEGAFDLSIPEKDAPKVGGTVKEIVDYLVSIYYRSKPYQS